MADEISDEETRARLGDARDPREAAGLVDKFTGSGFQAPAGSLHENYQQLKDAGVDDKTLAAVIRGKEAKAADKGPAK
ncbi:MULTISPECIES: hypothetical protein [Kribbella]|uniref:Uncharacterized protein n=2 Tax=Kribbella TaxID=182639 RepID=A0A4R0J1N3_9ACTN|nr:MULTISPECIES: hypothetical protein [Kribbella]TCC16612.1 hypothetical protein E0H58_39760 [Kribbella speibonae]TCC35045.1 hypothetical protein E0H50_14310 [Kribbella sindirgiensis]